MDELNREYTLLFNGITDTIQQLEHTISRLKILQIKAEEEYLRERDGMCADEKRGRSTGPDKGGCPMRE